jgi:L-rhamnose-H+ transport protein
MTPSVAEALGLIFMAALMNAVYTLPMKVNRNWAWEHSWLAFTVLGVVAVPTALAVMTIPGLFSIYPGVSPGSLAAMAIFGAGWGVSLVFFGLALTMVGIGITFAVCLGTSAASGALIPLIAQHPEKIVTREGALILSGIALILAGVALCGIAANLRDRRKGTGGKDGARPVKGFVYAFLAGALGSLFNLGLAFGGTIQEAAVRQGAAETMTSNAVWLPCLYAGFIPGVVYCLTLMKKNGNTLQFFASSRWYYWLMAILMGTLWYGSILLYSISAGRLGELGTAIGWPLFLSSIVVASTVTGLLAREWSESGRRPLCYMFGGVLCLVLAVGVLSAAGSR